jgi:hypothetical protein
MHQGTDPPELGIGLLGTALMPGLGWGDSFVIIPAEVGAS